MNQFKHINIVTNNKICCDSKWINLIKKECDSIAKSNDSLAKNYTWDNLQVEKHKSFDILVHNDEIVSWCGLFNGGRYPTGIYRIMNRLYLNPKYRNKKYPAYARHILYPYQRSVHKDDIKMLFLSRDGLAGKYHNLRWIKYSSGEEGWTLSDYMIQVCNAEKKGCYQYISYKNFSDVNMLDMWNPKSISEEEWKLLND